MLSFGQCVVSHRDELLPSRNKILRVRKDEDGIGGCEAKFERKVGTKHGVEKAGKGQGTNRRWRKHVVVVLGLHAR
jgi:hypothetical protein